MISYLESYFEVPAGKHLFSFGHRLNSFTFGIHISRYAIDINMFPFFIGLEFNGVLIDQQLSKIVAQRISEYQKTQNK